ncbi:hypothetical protein [Phytoactinopolyspora mesophila]|uniref:MFS transporter n=1 Tax=Phytoactinopolyspora mesophila TaxID=2650750 RepID=A0A7K3MBI9_9ACTN|nr:hypothetical protein [Phytoactinopolyspora mesophila]NDL60691.1 hypothetical protein [Phytoactinopolyspora mesophila]
MHEPGRGKVRAARGLVMAAACLLLPAAAHMAAGGSAPIQLEFVFAAGLLSIACVALADRRRNPAEITTVVFLTQPLLHLLFSLAGHDHPTAVGTGAMLVAHIVAAACMAVLLCGAEAVVWAFAALSTTILFSRARQLLRSQPISAAKRCVPNTLCDAPSLSTMFVATSAPRRGPPSAAVL